MHLKFYNEYVMLVNTFGAQTICILFSELIADITKNLMIMYRLPYPWR